MKHVNWALLLLFLLLFSGFGVLTSEAQTPAYTQSISAACQQETCNGLPVDQGGAWQFILGNGAFSIYSNGFYIFGNPGNPGSGGITNVQDGILEPPNPYQNGSVGKEGTLTFNWAAVNQDRSHHYVGHATLSGHEVRHCNWHGCWDQVIVDSAQIYIDSVN